MTLKLSLMRWCITLVGVQFLCGIVWVLGPLLAPLESQPARVAVLFGLLLLWAAANFALDWGRTRRESALANGMTHAGQDEAAAIGAKLAGALTLLRKTKGRRAYLYEQPWYAIIGPPGAGKTTALLNSGLEFPLAGALGPGAVAGVGGTRQCDWWFTQEAVLIDTAGRYTTQDSNVEVDRAGWEAFLSLLRKARPRQPLNGIIVAMALSDLAADGSGMLEAHARAIRGRVDELEARLGLRMPVYLLFTKADLVIGFTEFFDDLDRTGREQIWGTTFPLTGLPDVPGALRSMIERLDRRTLPRLDAESSPERRVLIAGFTAQFASIVPAVQTFMASAFGAGPNGHAPLLRGLYFASGTQEGTPVDRLVGALARSFGIDQRRAAVLRPEAGRSYFLAELLRNVVFREAMLVSARPGAERRRRVLRVAGFSACLLAALLGFGFIWSEHASGVSAIGRAAAALTAATDRAAGLPLDPVADADFARLVPLLDAARADRGPPPPPPLRVDRIGFDQGAKLAGGGQAFYRHALNFALFPRLIWRLEEQMRGMLGQPDALYEATRIYLMLGGGGPLDRPLVQEWFARDWAATPAGENGTDLARHLAALLAEPLPAVALDGPLVAQARATFGRVPLAQRAYSRLKPLPALQALPPWRPSDALGPAGVRVFLRLSGRALAEGIPGTYTSAGFRDAVLPAIALVARDAAAENWVIGEPIDPDSPRRRSLESDIVALYAAEYIAAWNGVLNDLDPTPLRNLSQAAQDLFVLASPHSPIRALLASAAAETAPAAGWRPASAPAAGSRPASAAAPAPVSAMAVVDEKFRPLRDLFGGTPVIDQVLRPLGNLQQQLAKQAASTTHNAAPTPGEDPAAALRAEALRQPQPLARWLVSLATGGAALRDGGPRGAMIAAWNAGGGPAALCAASIGARYPFVPVATTDVSLEDFTRLFGPAGAIDAFFNTQLKPYVDVSAKTWRLKAVDGVDAPLSPADLAQFQRAAAIRDLFFPTGSTQPLVRFDVAPGALDPAATSASLDIGSATIVTRTNAPARPVALAWPGKPAATSARLVVTAPPPAASLVLEAAGPWALFRLFGRAHSTVSGDHVSLLFSGNDRQARLDIRATPNPFTSALPTEFHCPAVQ